jgi:dTMP kinase
MGLFIVVNGPDGSGKSQMLLNVKNKMEKMFFFKNNDIYITGEPGFTKLGKKIRKLLLKPEEDLSGLTEVFLFLADRAQHIEKYIKPKLERENSIILCDRYWECSLVYQCLQKEIIEYEDMIYLHKKILNLIKPNLMFIIDSNKPHNLKGDRYDNLGNDFRESIAKHYRTLIDLDCIDYQVEYINTTECNWNKYQNRIINSIKRKCLYDKPNL